MISKLEAKIRKLDNVKLGISSSSRRIAERLGIKFRNVHIVLTAKRQNFKRTMDYLDHLARQNGYISRAEYRDHLKIQEGFLGRKDYEIYSYYRRKGRVKNKEEYFDGLWRKQEQSETNEELYALHSRDNLPIEFIEEKEEVRIRLKEALNELPERYREVIIGRFYKGRLQEEIGKEFCITKQRVGQMQKAALTKLYDIAIKYSLQDYYYEKD